MFTDARSVHRGAHWVKSGEYAFEPDLPYTWPGHIWQEPPAGPITFYYLDENRLAGYCLKQYRRDGHVYQMKDVWGTTLATMITVDLTGTWMSKDRGHAHPQRSNLHQYLYNE